MSTVQKLITEYRQRIVSYDTLLADEEEMLRAARKAGDPQSELAIRRAEVRRLNDLRQICIQVIVDIESLEEQIT